MAEHIIPPDVTCPQCDRQSDVHLTKALLEMRSVQDKLVEEHRRILAEQGQLRDWLAHSLQKAADAGVAFDQPMKNAIKHIQSSQMAGGENHW